MSHNFVCLEFLLSDPVVFHVSVASRTFFVIRRLLCFFIYFVNGYLGRLVKTAATINRGELLSDALRLLIKASPIFC